MIKCLIVDLDDTLINTQALEHLRSERRWGEVGSRIHLCTPHSQVLDVISTVRSIGLKICVVTNSPSHYAQRLLKYFDISVDYLVGYHDVRKPKPDSEGIERVLFHFQISALEAVYLGDSIDDFIASNAANVAYFAVDWSNETVVPIQNRGVSKLLEYIGSRNSCFNSNIMRSDIIQNGNHFYLGYYLTGIKQEIWAFKDGQKAAIDRWINKTKELAHSLPQVDYIVRAFGHAETQVSIGVNRVPLDDLSESLAVSLSSKYLPHCLKKDRVLVKSTKCSSRERKLQVKGAYSIDVDIVNAIRTDPITFLVVDDVMTSGATVEDIKRALSIAYPKARIYFFTLVKTMFRLHSDSCIAETRHNNQLFADLYTTEMEPAEYVDNSPKQIGTKLPRVNLVAKSFTANYSKTNHNFICYNLKTYSIASEPESKTTLNAIYILKNILQRGTPTIASRKLRHAFSRNGHDIESNALQALISKKPIRWERLIRGDSKTSRYPARYFFDELIPKYFGDYAFVKQLTLPEVQIFDMTQVHVDQFNNRQVDFYIPQIGLIIEIDGQQHKLNLASDESRDAFTNSLGLKTIRFTTEEIANENQIFLDKVSQIIEHIRFVDRLEQENLITVPNGLTLQHYKKAYIDGIDITSPDVRLTASIRFQLLLLELLERGEIRLGERTNIILRNPDGIDFCEKAIDDLNEHLIHLLALLGIENLKLDLSITEVSDTFPIVDVPNIKIDFSIFERFDDSFQTNQDTIVVRTHYFDFYRTFSAGNAARLDNPILHSYDFFEMACNEPISYELDLSPDSKHRNALKFLLGNLFLPFIDEFDFREGQIGIIGSALARKGTIGLLPTGSGKSICYQLSAILQPAISFVVCPIKSLMYDQKSDLDSIGFTRCNFITSDLSPEQKSKIQNEYGHGRYFFVFISPERFQTHQFRTEMTAIGLDRSFAYAVIDEAHCLSEWGHDFRTSYLNLSNTIDRLAPESTYIGLTATASVNVLKDIQAEFRVSDENIRTPTEFTREELSFHVIDDKGHKNKEVTSLVLKMEDKWNKNGAVNAGIIFTPTVNGSKGCFKLAGHLSKSLGMEVHFFSGSAPEKYHLRGSEFDAYKHQIQRDFKENKYTLLTATKAFGMGVNKGNIAYTIHFGIPSSMEALYQEAGRAGRDKNIFKKGPADCHVLLTKESNLKTLDTIWDASSKVKDLKDSVEKLSRESDISTNMFLMTMSLDTINDGYSLISRIYAFLEQNKERSRIQIIASQFNTDKSKLEKAVYRLFQLGIVTDWVIEDFFLGKLLLDYTCLSEDQLEINIQKTIRKYDNAFIFTDLKSSRNENQITLNDRFELGLLNKTQYIILVLLLWSYDHFVYNRRQSLKTVYEQCCDLASGQINESEFKNRLESYFKFNNASHRLYYLAENTVEASKWLSVFYDEKDNVESQQLVSQTELIIVKEQLSRFLESYKDNACLNYLSGVLRLIFDQFDDPDGERRMASSLDRLAISRSDEIELLVKETIRLKQLISDENQCRFAQLIYEKFPKNNILKILHEGLGDAYTYKKLLEPIVIRLELLNKSLKGFIS